jgi:hypothetical protein
MVCSSCFQPDSTRFNKYLSGPCDRWWEWATPLDPDPSGRSPAVQVLRKSQEPAGHHIYHYHIYHCVLLWHRTWHTLTYYVCATTMPPGHLRTSRNDRNDIGPLGPLGPHWTWEKGTVPFETVMDSDGQWYRERTGARWIHENSFTGIIRRYNRKQEVVTLQVAARWKPISYILIHPDTSL